MLGKFHRDIHLTTERENYGYKCLKVIWNKAQIYDAEEQALKSNYIKYRIDKASECDKDIFRGQNGESVWHITTKCA